VRTANTDWSGRLPTKGNGGAVWLRLFAAQAPRTRASTIAITEGRQATGVAEYASAAYKALRECDAGRLDRMRCWRFLRSDVHEAHVDQVRCPPSRARGQVWARTEQDLAGATTRNLDRRWYCVGTPHSLPRNPGQFTLPDPAASVDVRRSRIVLSLTPGNVVTASRSDTMFVVTDTA
jgi:hypothetical protein